MNVDTTRAIQPSSLAELHSILCLLPSLHGNFGVTFDGKRLQIFHGAFYARDFYIAITQDKEYDNVLDVLIFADWLPEQDWTYKDLSGKHTGYMEVEKILPHILKIIGAALKEYEVRRRRI